MNAQHAKRASVLDWMLVSCCVGVIAITCDMLVSATREMQHYIQPRVVVTLHMHNPEPQP